MKHHEKNIIFGLYNDEEDLKSAVRKANEDHLPIMDVYTPFAVHGLDPLLGLAESRLHIGGFVYGTLTCRLFETRRRARLGRLEAE